MFKSIAAILLLVAAAEVQGDTFLHPRIVGGQAAEITSYPFVVQVSTNLGECLGTIIRNDAILTAASCIPRRRPTATVTISASGQVIQHQRIVTDRRFNFQTRNDIAIIFLSSTIDTNSASIVSLNQDDNDYLNSDVNVVGWTNADALQHGVPKISQKQSCVRNCVVQRDQLFFCLNTAIVPVHTLKATEAGGPVFVQQNGAFLQIGVLSNGGRDCQQQMLAVANRVSDYTTWIEQQLSAN